MVKTALTFLAVAEVFGLLSSAVLATTPGSLVSLDFIKQKRSQPITRTQQRRRTQIIQQRNKELEARQTKNTVEATLTNTFTNYLINITVGTPPQKIAVILDTGSSDLWLPSKKSGICEENSLGCDLGSYDNTTSSSFKMLLANEFEISYGDGTHIQGDYVSETIAIDQTEIKNMIMGYATKADDQHPLEGIMGIGYANNEAIASIDPTQIFNTTNGMLLAQSSIGVEAYSLWLNDLNADSGSILWGGVDTSKYKGNLVALPIQKDAQSGDISSFTVAMTGLSLETESGSTNVLSKAQPALLDSGTTLTLLADADAKRILSGLGAAQDSDYGTVIPCSVADHNASFRFTFGGANGVVIDVPLREFAIDIEALGGVAPKFQDGSKACLSGIDSAGRSGPVILGDTFLRSAYVVYDLSNNQIGIAPTNFDSKTSNIIPFTNDNIPGVSSTASGATAAQTLASTAVIPAGTGIGGGAASATSSAKGSVSSAASATFNLGPTDTAAAGSGAGTGSSSGPASTSTGAASGLVVPKVQGTLVVAGAVTVLSFLGGSMFMFM